MKIAIVAPGGRILPALADRVRAFVSAAYEGKVELVFDPQCFCVHGHFAGDDALRAEALVKTANDPSVDAVWFARGGYGTSRIGMDVLSRLDSVAGQKIYMGYSDCGFLLSLLDAHKVGLPCHGPMPCDLAYEKGPDALCRALDFMLIRKPAATEETLSEDRPAVAMNLSVLCASIGTSYAPDLDGRVLMVEEVGEYMYRIDRMMAQVMQSSILKKTKGIRMGRCSGVPVNDPEFLGNEVDVARFWCEKANVPYLGRADIGHDADNKVVPFGHF